MRIKFLNSLMVLLILVAGSFPAQAGATLLRDSHDNLLDTQQHEPSYTKVIALKGALDGTGAKLWHDYGAFALYKVPAQELNSLNVERRNELHIVEDTLLFDNYPFNTQQEGLANIPDAYQTQSMGGQALQLIQFVGPIKEEWLQTIRAQGAAPIHYIANNGYLVWADSNARNRLASLAQDGDIVQFSAPYQTYFKLGLSILGRLSAVKTDAASAQEVVPVVVQVYAHPGVERTQALIESLLTQKDSAWTSILSYQNIYGSVRVHDLATIAAQPDVVWVGEHFEPELMDEVQGQILAGHFNTGQAGPASPGYLEWLTETIGVSTDPADYPIVDITDDGVGNGTVNSGDPTLHQFGSATNPSRLAYVSSCTSSSNGEGVDGHGHINTSIVGSYDFRNGFPFKDPHGYLRGLGVNPFGRIASTSVFDQGYFDTGACGGTDTGLIKHSQDLGAQISTNSWGCSLCAKTYDESSQAYDVGVRDADLTEAGNQQMIFFFAAGNAGSSNGTVGTPGNGKNMITVGASENYRPTDENGDWVDRCDIDPTGANNAMDVIYFSSRGPAPGGRAKPELVAPGTHIQGTASSSANYTGNSVCDMYRPSNQTVFAASSGTSHSTPAVAGVGSLYYYWLEHQYGIAPSPAMMKAYLIAHPTYLTGQSANDTLPSNNKGYGMPNMELGFDDTPRYLLDQSHLFNNTGEQWNFSGVVADPSKPVRIVLAYTDKAAALGSSSPLVNDLDLRVENGGSTYLGNHFSGQWSVIRGTPDRANNYEAIFLPAGTNGILNLTVTAANIADDGVPNVGDATDQDFAIVVYNILQPEGFGVLEGTLYDAATSQSLPNVSVVAQGTIVTNSASTMSSMDGSYHIGVLTDTLTVTAAAFGYQTTVIEGVQVMEGMTTTLPIPMTPANWYTVTGIVGDANTGWPLYARITIDGYPGEPVWNDPVDGSYTIQLPEGFAHMLWVEAFVSGYSIASHSVAPLTGNAIENIELQADTSTCNAPGYSFGGFGESFDRVTPPALPKNWAAVDVVNELGHWLTSAGSHRPSDASSHSTPNLVYFNSFSTLSESTRLYRTSAVDMTALSSTDLRFWMYHNIEARSYSDRVQVQVSTDGGAIWTNVGDPVLRYDGSAGWAQHTISLADYSSANSLLVGLLGISDNGYDIHVDDIVLDPTCNVPTSGGVLVGYTYDENTSKPLVGVSVTGSDSQAVSVETPDDPAVGDGLYILYTAASQAVTATIPGGYLPDVAVVNVTPGGVAHQDFALPAGKLVADTTPLHATVDMGSVETLTLTLENTGSGLLSWKISELPGGQNLPLVTIPSFEEIVPASNVPDSLDRAPQNGYHTETNEPAYPPALLTGEPAYGVVISNDTPFLFYMPNTTIPGVWEHIADLSGSNYFAGDFINDDFSTLYVLDYELNQLHTIDTAIGTVMAIGPATPVAGEAWTGMAGTSNGTLYASSSDCGGSSTLYTVDPATGVLTIVGNTGIPCLIDVAINTDNEMYGVDVVTDLLFQIDPKTGTSRPIGSIGFNAHFAQDMDFDEKTGVLYLAAFNGNSDEAELRIADTTTGNTALLGLFQYQTEVDAFAFPTTSNVPWLSGSPHSGSITISEAQPVEVVFDATQVDQPGTYYASLKISSDTPYNTPVVPVTMTVQAPPDWGAVSGTVTGLGQCGASPASLEGAEVVIKGSGETYTVTTDSQGRYLLWLPAAEGPLTIRVSAGSYQEASVNAVAIAAGHITTQDFDLRLLAPCISVEPHQFTVTLSPGDLETLPLKLLNNGAASTTFKIAEKAHIVTILVVGNDASGDLITTTLAGLGYNYQYVPNEEFLSIPAAQILAYQAIFYAGTPSPEILPRLIAYLNAGGALYVSDNNLGRDLGDTDFYKTYLQATYQVDTCGDMLAGENIMAEMNLVELASGADADGFTAGTEGTRIFRYTSSGYAGGVAINRNGYKAIYTAFDLANLESTTEAASIIEASAKYLTSSNEVPWLLEDPSTGTLTADSTQAITVTFDATNRTTGTYIAALAINSNDPLSPTIQIPVVMNVVSLENGVVLAPPTATTSGLAGETITYTLQITNTGVMTNTFSITTSGNSWDVAVPSVPITLTAGASTDFSIVVTIPPNAVPGTSDTVTITATGAGGITDSSVLVTQVVIPGGNKIFLPLIMYTR
ncbi:MAG: S8 family serine peptidase [Chloroflexota bacterium]